VVVLIGVVEVVWLVSPGVLVVAVVLVLVQAPPEVLELQVKDLLVAQADQILITI